MRNKNNARIYRARPFFPLPHLCSQEPVVAEAAAVQGPFGPLRRQHGRVPGGIRADGGLRAQHVRLPGAGRGWPARAAQLRPGVLHA